MGTLEIFNTLRKLNKSYCLAEGRGTIKDGELSEFYVYATTGLFEEALINEAFGEDYKHNVEKDGEYAFEALLSYSPEQRGSYPPPNLECQAYLQIEHIEYIYIEPAREPIDVTKIPPSDGEDLPF